MSASVAPSSVSCPFATPGRFTAGTTAPETMWHCSRPASWHVASESPPESPRVSPKPYARSRATRPPTVNRPASAIPLTETCAASETRRVARLRAASCATPASLPSASPRMGHGRDRRRLPFGEWTRVCLFARSPVGGIHRADRRVLRSKMATVVCPKKLGASCSSRRSDGQRVCQPLPSRKIRDKGAEAVGRDSKWRISRID